MRKIMAGEPGEVTIENGRFSIPIEFLTQSRRPVLSDYPSIRAPLVWVIYYENYCEK